MRTNGGLSQNSRLARAAIVLLVAIAQFGCGSSDGIPRVIVNGKVTHAGQAVECGQIRFIPQDVPAPVTIAPVQAGSYRCDHAGGVPVGTHRVEILAWNPQDPQPKGPGEKPRRQLLPAQYNKQSQLVCTIEVHDGPVQKDFALE
jgi:hypothetical protein